MEFCLVQTKLSSMRISKCSKRKRQFSENHLIRYYNVLCGAHFIFIESCDQSRCYRIPLSSNSSDFDDSQSNSHTRSLSPPFCSFESNEYSSQTNVYCPLFMEEFQFYTAQIQELATNSFQ